MATHCCNAARTRVAWAAYGVSAASVAKRRWVASRAALDGRRPRGRAMFVAAPPGTRGGRPDRRRCESGGAVGGPESRSRGGRGLRGATGTAGGSAAAAAAPRVAPVTAAADAAAGVNSAAGGGVAVLAASAATLAVSAAAAASAAANAAAARVTGELTGVGRKSPHYGARAGGEAQRQIERETSELAAGGPEWRGRRRASTRSACSRETAKMRCDSTEDWKKEVVGQ